MKKKNGDMGLGLSCQNTAENVNTPTQKHFHALYGLKILVTTQTF